MTEMLPDEIVARFAALERRVDELERERVPYGPMTAAPVPVAPVMPQFVWCQMCHRWVGAMHMCVSY